MIEFGRNAIEVIFFAFGFVIGYKWSYKKLQDIFGGKDNGTDEKET